MISPASSCSASTRCCAVSPVGVRAQALGLQPRHGLNFLRQRASELTDVGLDEPLTEVRFFKNFHRPANPML